MQYYRFFHSKAWHFVRIAACAAQILLGMYDTPWTPQAPVGIQVVGDLLCLGVFTTDLYVKGKFHAFGQAYRQNRWLWGMVFNMLLVVCDVALRYVFMLGSQRQFR